MKGWERLKFLWKKMGCLTETAEMTERERNGVRNRKVLLEEVETGLLLNRGFPQRDSEILDKILRRGSWDEKKNTLESIMGNRRPDVMTIEYL